MRLIDADALYKDICDSLNEMTALGIAVDGEWLWAKFNDAIDNAPTIEEHKTGKWIQDQKSKRYRCDQCLSFALKTDDMQENLSDFCPVCGSYNGGKNEI